MFFPKLLNKINLSIKTDVDKFICQPVCRSIIDFETRLTDHHENWYTYVVIYGEES